MKPSDLQPLARFFDRVRSSAPTRQVRAWILDFLIAAAAGGAAIALRGAAADSPIELPPMIVESATAGGPQWRHGVVPGFEVLSCCDDDMTNAFVERTRKQHELLAEFVPARIRFETTVPTTLILFSTLFERSMNAEIVAEMERVGDHSSSPGASTHGYHGIPQLRLSDEDSTAIYFILGERPHSIATLVPFFHGPMESHGDDDYSTLILAPEYFAFLLHQRAPALPSWFVAGMFAFYESAGFANSDVQVAPIEWISSDETHALAANADRPRVLVPMGDLFAPIFGGSDPQRIEYRSVCLAQAKLFVRWAFEDPSGERRRALWRFAERAATEPVTEGLFKECFGIGYADARDLLSDSLPRAVSESLSWKIGAMPAPPPLTMEHATPQDIRRIKGDWELREISFVAARYPKLAKPFIEETRQTLWRAYDSGDRDPRLLATYGLFAAEYGNPIESRGLLETAFLGHGMRPYAAIELGRARLAAALSAPEAAHGRLSAAQTASVLEPLLAAHRDRPLLAEIFELATNLYLKADAPPKGEALALIREGGALFPRHSDLVIDALLWCARAGDIGSAIELGQRGAVYAHDPEYAQRFSELLKQLDLLKSRSQPVQGEPPAAAAVPDPIVHPRPAEASRLALSPDGRRLAYWTGSDGAHDQLITMELDFRKDRKAFRVPRTPGSAAPPVVAWSSPERLTIGIEGHSIVSANATGGDVQRIDPTNHQFAPLGQLLAAAAVGPGPTASSSNGGLPRTNPDWTVTLAELGPKFPSRDVALLGSDQSHSRFLCAVSGGTHRRYYIYRRPEGLLLEVPLPAIYN